MRFMVIVKASKDSEAGKMPSKEMLETMGAFNEELVKAGVMLAGEGLWDSSHGARIRFENGKATKVIDGPFAETKELVAGFWLVQMKSKEECVAWFSRCPAPHEGEPTELEIRRVFDPTDFPDASREMVARELELRAEADKKLKG